ncbi:coiled-coil domain-containing protein 92 [Paramormyrops kingsleyae]|uniref:Coiled-coil domain containing 92 n=1 Tax=Paramormyrops kingsleyae TaxID=1676925 RepID=A0A3B3QLB4_9TELE|nr:coiled-coil domain-containing protein 92 [Paramormyrops kingsleyae]XP_023658791.1 coiled-coil domain-containing protein 92 [Paramormyrops kingsleyae]
MASISLENQLQSAQNNLLFLQQDHANTLKGLHAEIRRLQQHCTDLTYELMVKSSDPADGGEARCAELHRRCEELEMQLKAKEEENTELMRDLEQKTAMISVLENTIKEREKKYLEELKLKSHRLAVLSGELEQRAGTIAYLTAQLHATKKRLLSGGSSEGSPGGSPAASYKPAPPPPREQQPDTPRRRMRKSLSQPLHADYAELCRVGADGRRLALRDALDAMPDPTPFLQARELAAEASLPRERPAVIPPISRERSPAPPDPASPRHGLSQQPRAHVGVAHRIHRSAPPTAAQPEIQTLAVDQVNDGKVARKESGTDRTV